jgi:hypothetical protein
MIFLFLVLDILTDCRFIITNRGYIIPSGPEMLAGKVFATSHEIPGNMDGTFTFDETNHLRHRILRRYGDQHVDMIRSKMAFQYLTLPLIREVFEC